MVLFFLYKEKKNTRKYGYQIPLNIIIFLKETIDLFDKTRTL